MQHKHFFASGNTQCGFVDLFSSNLQGIEKIFILKGGPGTGKSTLIKKVAKVCEEEGLDAEILHCSSDPDSLDGIIIPALSVAVVDGTQPHVIEPTAPGAIEEYVNLGKAWDSGYLKTQKDTILEIKAQIKTCFDNAYEFLNKAHLAYEEWKKYYTKNTKFDKVNKICENLINSILKDISLDKAGKIKRRFSFSQTPKGVMDYIHTILNTVSKRYYLKGRPGTGKSTILAKLYENALQRGLDMEVYYNGLNADKIHMILFPELDLIVFDSTLPHEFETIDGEDEVIDIFKECVKPNVETKHQREIQGICAQYNIWLNKSIRQLENAKKLHDQLENIYVNSINFNVIDEITGEVLDYVKNKIEKQNNINSDIAQAADDNEIENTEDTTQTCGETTEPKDEIEKNYEEFYGNINTDQDSTF